MELERQEGRPDKESEGQKLTPDTESDRSEDQTRSQKDGS